MDIEKLRELIPVTAVILTYNEEAIISKTIENIYNATDKYVAEVVVADTASTDNTVEVAKNAGARVIQLGELTSFSKARNDAMKDVFTEWTLFIDADEIFPQKTKDFFPVLINHGRVKQNISAFYFWRISVFDDIELGTEYQPRLLRTKECKWNDAIIHEGIVTVGDVKEVQKDYYFEHRHSMNKQLFSNLLYQKLLQGESRPPRNRGAEYHGGKWVEIEIDKNG